MPQDIFTPLYNHQIPPGAGQTVHYELRSARGPRRAGDRRGQAAVPQVRPALHGHSSRRRTRSWARTIRGHEPGQPYGNELPDHDAGVRPGDVSRRRRRRAGRERGRREFPLWQRWNDYGIGLLLKGKAELRQAAEAFPEVEKSGPLGRSAESGARLQHRRTPGRGGRGAAAGRRLPRRGGLSPLDLGLAQRRRQPPARPSGRGDAQPAQRARGPHARHAAPQVRFQPRLRGTSTCWARRCSTWAGCDRGRARTPRPDALLARGDRRVPEDAGHRLGERHRPSQSATAVCRAR